MDPDHAREILTRERTRIEGALAKLRPQDGPEEDDPFDQGDVASDLLNEEIDIGFADSLRGELAAIERAEKRLADGHYGVSVESGEPIPDGRLELIPWAERTAEEQQKIDSLPG
jgi:DnaK suppressor protein